MFKNCKIKITKACGYNALLILDKQRFICKHCNRTFTAFTNVVDYHKQISNDTNFSVKLEFIQRGLEKSIGEYRENLLKNPETINIKKLN